MKAKPVKIAVIADVHYDPSPAGSSRRRKEIADVLLLRTVFRLNRLVRPDVTLILGDILDNGTSMQAEKNLRHIRSILDRLDSPYIAIPGNHDNAPEAFYRVFDRPREIEDMAGVRFLPFLDQEEPGYNARRSRRDLDRLCMAGAAPDKPIVSLQHVCLCPPGDQPATPYNYTNADQVIMAMQEGGVNLSISGHHHPGAGNASAGGIMFVNAPGLCEAPFPFLEITIHGGEINTCRHELAMPADLHLVDRHAHTPLAYCSENLTMESSIQLAQDFGLAGITFTEHSGQLYFAKQKYWDRTCLREGMAGAMEPENRMADYLNLKNAHAGEGIRFGLEVDCDFQGRLLLAPDDRGHFDFLAGAIHALPALGRNSQPTTEDQDAFLYLLNEMLGHGIDVLAHPFRVFRRSGWPAPAELFAPTARLLKKHRVAAEINFHSNQPPLDFIRECLALDLKFSFGSDAHNLAEIGDFACHCALIREAGFDGAIQDILI